MTDTRKPSNKAAEPTITTSAGSQRRAWLGKAAKAATSLGILALVDPLVRSSAWAAGSDAPEKAEVKIGFIPLTDCASVVMASVMGFDKKHGVKIVPTNEASGHAVREKQYHGDHDFAHALYGMISRQHQLISRARQELTIPMALKPNNK